MTSSHTFWEATTTATAASAFWTNASVSWRPEDTAATVTWQEPWQVTSRPPNLVASVDVPFAEFDQHPDPDAQLGDYYETLRAILEPQLLQYGVNMVSPARYTDPEDTENAWRFWVLGLTAREDYETNTEHLTLTAVWQGWTDETAHYERPPLPRVPTAAERRREASIALNRRRARALRLKVAERRARELLQSCLDEEQRADLERANGFKVIVGDRTYWVAKGHSGNVYLLNERGVRVSSYCIHASSRLPDFDQMLAQKLLLETNESEFLRVANRSPVW